jgi:hypothetical protein
MIASKCSPRGILIRSSGEPHDAFSLSRMTGLPVENFAPAITRLLKIGWLETGPALSSGDPALSGANPALSSATPLENAMSLIPDHMAFFGGDPALSSGNPALSSARTERNGMERKRRETNGTSTARLSEGASAPVENPSFVSDPTTVKPKAPSRGLARDVLNPQRIDGMRRILHDYMAMKGTGMDRTVSPPDDGIVTQCLTAVGLRPLGDVAGQLRKLFQNGQSPRHPTGPKNYAWFVTVLQRQFAGEVASVPAEAPPDYVAGQPASGTGILPGGADAENQPAGFTQPDEALISRVMARAERANGWQAAGEDFEGVAV